MKNKKLIIDVKQSRKGKGIVSIQDDTVLINGKNCSVQLILLSIDLTPKLADIGDKVENRIDGD